MKSLDNEKTDGANCLYLVVNNVDVYIEVNNEDKYFLLVQTKTKKH